MKKFQWIIWVILIAIIGAAVWYWKFKPVKTEIVLETVHPYMGKLAIAVTATGRIEPSDTVAVGTQVSGTILKVFVDFNSAVKKGQLLAQLDKSVLTSQVDQFSANLQSAKANETYQKNNYDRQSKLYDQGVISKADLETALYQYQSAAASVNSIAAQLNSSKKNLSYTNIYSPIDGTVLSRSVSEGQTVAASLSTPTLFSIAKDLTRMEVQASVDEADIGNVKNGQRVEFTVDAFPADTFSGTVKEIRLRPSVTSNVVTYTTIIDAPNKELKLKPGMTASISIYTLEIDHTLLVPAKAFTFQPDSALAKLYTIQQESAGQVMPAGLDSTNKIKHTPGFVWLLKQNTMIRTPVMKGIDDETQIQILTGLTIEDEIVTGYHQTASTKKTTAKSPFMPTRPGGNRTRPTSPPASK